MLQAFGTQLSPVRALTVLGALGVSLAACSSAPESSPATEPDAACVAALHVDRFKELIVVDEAVTSDARASNAATGKWSFRHLVTELAPRGTDPAAFVLQWLATWNANGQVNTFATMRRPLTYQALICPWLQRSESNACNFDCSQCAGSHLDLAKSPFRFLGIANRTDRATLVGQPGELRMIFALTDGPADDPKVAAMPMTAIFEYRLLGADTHGWAQRWHSLSAHAEFDEPYRTELEALTESVVGRGTEAGPPLGELRTNERVLDWNWQMREFHYDGSRLFAAPTFNTPDISFNSDGGTNQELEAWITANRDQVLAGTHVLPTAMAGGQTPSSLRWTLPGVSESLRHNFALQTCGGCHMTEALSVDTAFHVSPNRSGIGKLSSFLNNPQDPLSDELHRREIIVESTLCPSATAAP